MDANEAKAHKVGDNSFTRVFSRIPYEEFAKILREDGEAFLEHPDSGPIKKQTVHKAKKKLSDMVGKEVEYVKGVMTVTRGNKDEDLDGYLFRIKKD